MATIRNARGGRHPDPLRAAHLAVEAGADGITAHLREDRRHISDADIARLKRELTRPLNFEMAATDEMLAIALRHVPHACCLVPEKREEKTTEGGLDVVRGENHLRRYVEELKAAGIRVSLFIEPDAKAIEAASRLGAQVVELHTGAYCDRALEDDAAGLARELDRLGRAARAAAAAGLEVHAGHGLTYNTVGGVARIGEVVELNIGHFLVGRGDLRRARRGDCAHARADGGGARRDRAGQARQGGPVIIGLGNDIIDIRRIEKTIERFGERFLARVFTDTERRKSDARAGRAASYAKRFAAKEACAKALGTGLRKGVFWRDMGVVNLASGRPTMVLTGGAAEQLRRITPAGLGAPRRRLPDGRFPAGPGRRRHLRRAARRPGSAPDRDRSVNCGTPANPLYGDARNGAAGRLQRQDAGKKRSHGLADQRQQGGGERLA